MRGPKLTDCGEPVWVISVCAAVSGRGAYRPQCSVSVVPQQFSGADQHYRHTHHQPRAHPVHQPAAGGRGSPDGQRPAPNAGQLHPHCDLWHSQWLRYAPQSSHGARPRDSGAWWEHRTSVSCPLYQSHHSGQPHGPPAGRPNSGLEACAGSWGQPGQPGGGGDSGGLSGGPEPWPRSRPS